MRLALFGGSFDPIHSGHLQAAVAAADACALDRVLVVPCGTPPHKQGGCRAGYEHRFRMVELACAADSRLHASRLEAPRPGGSPHYSVDTVSAVRSTMSYDGRLKLIIGADAFAEVGLWRDIERVVGWVGFIVVSRPGFDQADLTTSGVPALKVVQCAHPASSRVVRHRSKIGGSIADLAPAAVSEYIWEHGLYRTWPEPGAARDPPPA